MGARALTLSGKQECGRELSWATETLTPEVVTDHENRTISWAQRWKWLEENVDSELEMAGGIQGLALQRNSPGVLRLRYGSQFHLATEAPELRVLLFWGQRLTFQSSKAFPA